MGQTLNYYTRNYLKAAQRYESAHVCQLHEFLLSSLKPGGTLLELGCGSGRDAAFMISQGFKVLATDGCAPMIEQAKQHHPELEGHTRHLKLPDDLSKDLGLFNGIYAVAVLMHLSIQDIERTITAVASLLAPGGGFAFAVPARRHDVTTDDFDAKGRRFTALSPDRWKKLCLKNNLKIVRTMMSGDGLGRGGIVWMNCLAKFEHPKAFPRPVPA